MARAYKNLGTALIARGNVQDGFEALSQAFSLSPDVFDQSGAVTAGMSAERLAQQYFYLAKLSAASGDVDAALAFLGRAREVGYDAVAAVRNDPDFAQVESDERFAALNW
jgi:tetratricopeptide (TPR) repeat protein